MKLKQSDWDILFPVKVFKIGTSTLNLKPLSLKDIPAVVAQLNQIKDLVKEKDITIDNYKGKMVELSSIIINSAPELITIMSKLHLDDVTKLPISVVVSLLIVCIDINTKDQGDFIKNLLALANKMGELTGTTTAILGK